MKRTMNIAYKIIYNLVVFIEQITEHLSLWCVVVVRCRNCRDCAHNGCLFSKFQKFPRSIDTDARIQTFVVDVVVVVAHIKLMYHIHFRFSARRLRILHYNGVLAFNVLACKLVGVFVWLFLSFLPGSPLFLIFLIFLYSKDADCCDDIILPFFWG